MKTDLFQAYGIFIQWNITQQLKKTITDTYNMNLLDLILSERNQTWVHTLWLPLYEIQK